MISLAVQIVGDVRDYSKLSQSEIASENAIYRQLSLRGLLLGVCRATLLRNEYTKRPSVRHYLAGLVCCS